MEERWRRVYGRANGYDNLAVYPSTLLSVNQKLINCLGQPANGMVYSKLKHMYGMGKKSPSFRFLM